MKSHIYKRCDDIAEKQGLSFGKWINIKLSEFAEKGDKNLKPDNPHCFLCGRKANYRVITYIQNYCCRTHFNLLNDKYPSYVKGYKELKGEK